MTDEKRANPEKVDPENMEKARERLARADSSQSPTSQGTGTGSGPAGTTERGPADTARPSDRTPPSAGAQGVSSGLQPGGTIPKTGAGGTGDVRGNIRTPGGQSGDGGAGKA